MMDYTIVIMILAVVIAAVVIFVAIKKSGFEEPQRPDLLIPNERPYWNTTLGGGYYGSGGWPFWAYYTGFPYGECKSPCSCSTPFVCEQTEVCPTFSGCTYKNIE